MSGNSKKAIDIAIVLFVGVSLVGQLHILARSRGTGSHWEFYRNERWNFCLRYPFTWSKVEPFDGSGVMLYPPQKNVPWALKSSISVGALPNQLTDITSGSPRTLEENFKEGIQGLGKNVAVLEKRSINIEGSRGLLTKIRYEGTTAGITWEDIEITFITKEDVLYSLELKCRPNEVIDLEPIFEEIAYRTFKRKCKATGAG